MRVPAFAPAANAVGAAWAAVTASSEIATSVMHSHAQDVGDVNAFAVRDVATSVEGAFGAQAAWRGPDGAAHGAVVVRTTKKAAHQRAVVSLLGHLCGAEPVEQEELGRRWVPAPRYSGGSTGERAELSFAVRLQQALELPQVAPAVVAEVEARIVAGELIPRDVHAVLFTAVSPGWAPAQTAALRAAAAEPGLSVAVLTLYQSVRNLPAPSFDDERKGGGSGLFRSRLRCAIDGRVVDVVGPWVTSKRLARGAAAIQVLADLAELPLEEALQPPPSMVEPLTEKRGADSDEDELWRLQERGTIRDLVFKDQPGITGLEPLYVCVAACTNAGRVMSGTGRSLGRSSARAQAAQELLAAVRLARAPKTVRQGRVPVPVNPRTNPLMVLNELKQKGLIGKLSVGDPVHVPGAGFEAVITCRVRVGGTVLTEKLSAEGAGATKRAAQHSAAEALVEQLATPVKTESGPVVVPVQGVVQRPGQSGAGFGPAGLTAGALQVEAARAALVGVLEQGAEVTVDLQDAAARFLVYRPDGLPMEPNCPPPMQQCTATLVLPREGAAVGPGPVECWQVPVRLLTNALAQVEDGGKESHSATVWRQVIRLGLEVVAGGRVRPGLDPAGRDVWRAEPLNEQEKKRARQLRQALTPPAHCGLAADVKPFRLWAPRVVVRAALDTVAEAMLRGPGTAVVLGSGPFTAPLPRVQSHSPLVSWADDMEEERAGSRALDLVLSVRAPRKNSPEDTELLWADLRLRDPRAEPTRRSWVPAASTASDPQITMLLRRQLRRLAALWPPLERLLERPVADEFTLRATEAVVLRGSTVKELARLGMAVEWEGKWTDRLRTRVVLGSPSPCPPSAQRPSFSLTDVLDGRWQMSVADEDLTEEEMDGLADTPVPLSKVRGQWVLVDEDTARRAADRQLPPLSSGEALRASLTGELLVEGHLVHCEPAEALADLVDFLRSGARTTPVQAPEGLQAGLRDYQRQGMAWLANTTDAGFGALLADDMGMGKTLTALALHLHRRGEGRRPAGPTLVLCPASVMINWEREARRFAPGVPTLRYHGPDRNLEDATDQTLVITTYETLRRDAQVLAERIFDLVIADEGQTIKNQRAATSRAARTLRSSCRVALTGTPVENHLGDAWAIMDFLNPGLFGTYRAFREQYAKPIEDNVADSGLTGRLAALLSAFMLRRRKSDPGILSELPPKHVGSRIVALSDEQVHLYNEVADRALRELRDSDGIARKGLLLTLFGDLQKVCNSPSHYLRLPADAPWDPVRESARSAKLAALDDLLPVLTDPEESTLIFTRYRAMARQLLQHLRAHDLEPLYFSGDLAPGAPRQQVIDAFQSARGQVMVMTLQAGGTGLTLTQASHVVLFDRPWNPAKENQAVDRAHRIGQQSPLTVHRIITENTLEDRVDELLRHKRALAEAVLTHGYSALTELADDQIYDLISLGAQR
ncbi:SNF2-related protein [Kitasatospora sp. CB01950]|uniref:SNF2-related protein n=1 Tax=Kitasatospora sp. CB01950 TaxID=1703930 RepID=UPI00116103DB|nr:SNF2-related protein [Kitasatospora sp. CB01950]